MKKLEVGQRIDLYKITGDNGYAKEVFTVGTIRPEIDLKNCINAFCEYNEPKELYLFKTLEELQQWIKN